MLVSGCDEFVTARGRTTGISTQEYRRHLPSRGDEEPCRASASSPSRPGATRPGTSPSSDRSASSATAPSRSSAGSTGGAAELTLRVRPLLAFRGLHRLQTRDGRLGRDRRGPRRDVLGASRSPICPGSSCAESSPRRGRDPAWYRHFRYAEEAARGYDCEEDLWSPLEWEWTLRPDAQAFALFSLDEVAGDPDGFLDAERRRRQHFAPTGDSVFDELARPRRGLRRRGGPPRARRSWRAIRGSPTGGAQAMIAAPGLALAQGRSARSRGSSTPSRPTAATASSRATSRGDAGEPEYDSIDASLWFILAVEWFGRARRNPARPSPLLGAVRAIIDAYRRGTRSDIGVGPDGLLSGDSARPPADLDGCRRRRPGR